MEGVNRRSIWTVLSGRTWSVEIRKDTPSLGARLRFVQYICITIWESVRDTRTVALVSQEKDGGRGRGMVG